LKAKYINLKVFGCKEIKEPKQDNQHRLRSPMHERGHCSEFYTFEPKAYLINESFDFYYQIILSKPKKNPHHSYSACLLPFSVLLLKV